MAVALAGGSRAVLSHRDAAALWELRQNTRRRTEITVPGARHQLETIQFHCGRLPEDEWTVVDTIPVTTVPRTLLDLASVVAPRQVLFLAFLSKYRLPRPEVNAALRVGDRWIEADCLWRAKRVIVELDGRAAHDTAAAYEDDRARDRAATAAGWRVVRVTWRQLHDDPDELAADLRVLLR
jgi:hypothetical protein